MDEQSNDEQGKNYEGLEQKCEKLTNQEIDRYSRQILLSNVGVQGQLLLKKASVLIVGVGGLGCPASLYLSGSGIGHIGLVDYDEVEYNNLHRQILHSSNSIGIKKVESAANALKCINPLVKVSTFPVLLKNSNAIEIISKFDIIIDATDNVPTRYLLNDACVLLSKPLVSGSALKMEGQLTIYNYKNGPCYRCIFPQPPPPETIGNCTDTGVLGVIPGTIGVLQALEAIKIIMNQETIVGNMLLFDGTETSFRKIKLRQKNSNCSVCGENPIIKNLIDYEQFCGSKSNDKNPNLNLLPTSKRIKAKHYDEIKSLPHVLIDVRSNQEFQICNLKNAINIPIDKIYSHIKNNMELIENETLMKSIQKLPVYVVCRRGNDSQKAVINLEKRFPGVKFMDIIGGLHAWAEEVDPSFPIY